MKNGICPKCASMNIYFKPNELRDVKLHGRLVESLDYICIDCGYFESYVVDKDALSKVAIRAEKLGDWKKAG